MKNKFSIFPWSDNWWVENDEAWFVLGAKNILCRFNLNTNKCKLLAGIPDLSKSKFRLTSYCMKYKNDIYCMPVCGKSIWIYNLENNNFLEIHVDNAPEEGLDIYDFWEHKGRIFAVSIRLKKIIEINVIKRKIENYYDLCREDSITRSVKAGTAIYSLSGTEEKIYRFDLDTKEETAYQLPRIGRRFNTIAFDGNNFWMGGYRKEIYLWNEKKNTVDIYSGFPSGFGMYSFEEDTDSEVDYPSDGSEVPAFLHSVAAGKYIWFIPFQTNKIIYINKECHKPYAFEIAEEIENKESLSERTELKAKYLLEYVKDNRYIGLFSIKNNRIVEIDAVGLTYKWYDYRFDDGCLELYAMLTENVFYEKDVWDRQLYYRMLHLSRQQKCENKECYTGLDIHEMMKED